MAQAVKDVCCICHKNVYPMDKVTADDRILHKTCVRCGNCDKVLSLGNYAALNGVFYCKPHFKQNFAVKGNYTDGFLEAEARAGVVRSEIPGAAAGPMKWEGLTPSDKTPVEKSHEAKVSPTITPAASDTQERSPISDTAEKIKSMEFGISSGISSGEELSKLKLEVAGLERELMEQEEAIFKTKRDLQQKRDQVKVLEC